MYEIEKNIGEEIKELAVSFIRDHKHIFAESIIDVIRRDAAWTDLSHDIP